MFTLEDLVELNNSVTVEVSFSNVIQFQDDHPEFVKINTTMYSVNVPVATLIGEGETVRIENTTTLYNSTRVTTKIHRVSVEATYMDAVPTQFVVGDNQLSAQGTELLGDRTRVIAEGEAVFSNLDLNRPAVGAYTFSFTPSDTSITAFDTQMAIVTGAPHHLGLYKPCATTPPPCTNTAYTAAVTTTLSDIQVVVLDGGDNFVGEDDFTGPHSVTVKLMSDGAALLGTTTLQTSRGLVTFDDLVLQKPLVGVKTLDFSAPGLYGTEIDLMVSTGDPYSLTLEPIETSAFPEGVESLYDYEALHETNPLSRASTGTPRPSTNASLARTVLCATASTIRFWSRSPVTIGPRETQFCSTNVPTLMHVWGGSRVPASWGTGPGTPGFCAPSASPGSRGPP